MPGEDLRSHRGATSPTSMNEYANNHAPSVAHESIAPSQAGSGGSRAQSGQVYVVHHDGGRAPVTVYHETGTEVVELPPRYAEDGPRTSYDLQSEGPSGSGGSDVSLAPRPETTSTSLDDLEVHRRNRRLHRRRPHRSFPVSVGSLRVHKSVDMTDLLQTYLFIRSNTVSITVQALLSIFLSRGVDLTSRFSGLEK